MESNAKQTLLPRSLVFGVAGTLYELDMSLVHEVRRLRPWLVIDDIPAGVAGYVDFGGEPVPLVDVRARVGLRPTLITRNMRAVVIELSGEMRGLLVDEVLNVGKTPDNQCPATVLDTDTLNRLIFNHGVDAASAKSPQHDGH